MKANAHDLRLILRSFLRILPAALIGLIPMHTLDAIFLEINYSFRGSRNLPDQIQILKIDPQEATTHIPKALEKYRPQHCVSIQLKLPSNSYCHFVDLNDYFSLNSLLDLKTKFQSWIYPEQTQNPKQYEPYYYGSFLEKLNLWQPDSSLKEKDIPLLVFVAAGPLPPFIFETPIGKLSSPNIALNILGNTVAQDELLRGKYKLQVYISILFFVAFAIFLIRFPIWLSGIVLAGSITFYWVLSLILLDQFHLALPIAAPLGVLALCYILSMTEQLYRREKIQWSLERETEFLREADDLRNHFLSLVSHDLKTPIARIQTLLEQLLYHPEQSLKPEQNTLIEKALRANSQLQRSIGTLLLLNRIESQDFKIQKRPTDMSLLIRESLETSRESAQERSIEIVTDLEPLFLAELDTSLIREVIYNLVDNAIKYSPEHSQIIVRCGESSILSELTPPRSGIWFEVQDAGPGISPEDRKKILQRFFSTESKNILPSRSVKGSGLGLYLSAFFVEKHGGRLSVLSRCPQETLSSDDPVQEYFPKTTHGTLVRVALPLDNLYIEDAS